MAVKAVVFDLDGTIASFNLDYVTVRADVRSFLIRAGLPGSILSTNESIFDMLKMADVFLKNNGKSDRAVNKVRNEALAIAENYELEAAKTTGLLPGAVETLEELKKMGLKIGLCTINSEKSTNYILKRFGVSKFFDAVTPRNKVKHVKPSSEHLEATLKALHVNPKEAILIGDGTRDMQCARELSVIAVGLSTGVSSEKELIASGASHFITSIRDLPRLVETINKSSRRRRVTGKNFVSKAWTRSWQLPFFHRNRTISKSHRLSFQSIRSASVRILRMKVVSFAGPPRQVGYSCFKGN